MESFKRNPRKNMNNPDQKDEKLTGEEALNKVETNVIQSGEVSGIVSERTTGGDPAGIAGVQDLDRGISRGSRRNR